MTAKPIRPLHDHEVVGCKHCDGVMEPMGKLPAMGLKPLIRVFRCSVCKRIASTET
jgi:hypothetical protein